LSLAIFVDVSVLGASPIEELLHRGRWLAAALAPLELWSTLVADASATATVVGVVMSRAITVVVSQFLVKPAATMSIE
jgi:hypothetical protein